MRDPRGNLGWQLGASVRGVAIYLRLHAHALVPDAAVLWAQLVPLLPDTGRHNGRVDPRPALVAAAMVVDTGWGVVHKPSRSNNDHLRPCSTASQGSTDKNARAYPTSVHTILLSLKNWLMALN